MPGGDGTGPMWAAPGPTWGGGGWCRGAGVGLGGQGWRNVYHATGLPGWVRRERWRAPWSFGGSEVEAERRDLEWHAGRLEAELQRIRNRIDELQDGRTENP
jgi:hypothetical protein